jgi:hypothetical protein
LPQLLLIGDAHRIPPEFQFDDWKLILAKGKIADAVIIATLVSKVNVKW